MQYVATLEFHNREQELAEVITSVSERLVLLVGMPNMGKTWFLKQLSSEFVKQGRSRPCELYVDLMKEQECMRSDVNKLLARMFGKDDLVEDWSSEIARFISNAPDTTYLILLDGVELLTNDCAVGLRQRLCLVIQELKSKGLNQRFGFIAASREEIPAFKGLVPQPSFKTVVLKHFSMEVIAHIFESTSKQQGVHYRSPVYERVGKLVWSETEGLPALFGQSLVWLQTHRVDPLGDPVESWHPKLLASVVKPYIRNELLNTNGMLSSRLPADVKASHHSELIDALHQVVLRTSVFRLLTPSHLTFLRHHDSGFSEAIDVVERHVRDTYSVITSLPLFEPRTQLWIVAYGAARRLFFKYAYEDSQEQQLAHQTAVQFYESWSVESLPGPALIQFLVERMWHQVELERRSCIEGASDRIRLYFRQLPPINAVLWRTFQQRMVEDMEIQLSLEKVASKLSTDLLAWL